MNSQTQRQRLRSKTGCLTCRNRRKKCDEQTPTCGKCALSGRQCQWPTSEELLDRRYASHQKSRYRVPPKSDQQPSLDGDSSLESAICLLSESVAHQTITEDLEVAISQHFTDQYYSLLLLPNCHPDFYHGWINEIKVLMGEHRSLRYSVLANAASHLHFIRESSQMQELALTYYSKALRGLSEVLVNVNQLENHNSILMSMMLLYLHGCMGRGTYHDIPRHLNAAARVLALRLFTSTPSFESPFDRLAVESVLYQVFLVATGLWSDDIPLDYEFDVGFWLKAEDLLSQSIVYPGQSNSLNSPVLGVPVPLFRLAISLKQLYQGKLPYDQEFVEQLRNEVEVWEAHVLCDKELDTLSSKEQLNYKHGYYKAASYLFVLIISMMLEQLPEHVPQSGTDTNKSRTPTASLNPGPPRMASPDSWQIKKVVQILRAYQDDDEWAGCFIGNWPVYTIGFFMSTFDDVALARRELQRRWHLTKFNQIARFANDLENTWMRRGLITSITETKFCGSTSTLPEPGYGPATDVEP